jgi:hypothetical protein
LLPEEDPLAKIEEEKVSKTLGEPKDQVTLSR